MLLRDEPSTRLDTATIPKPTTGSSKSVALVGNDKINNLAFTQSFGFFDDIPNDTWKRLQAYHRNYFPNHEADVKKHTGDKLRSNKWYNDNFHAEFHCPNQQRIPLHLKGDGAKWVCDPHRLQSKPDCLVYSVGSNGETSFEKGIRDVIGDHCEIHTFDLVTYNKRRGNFAANLEGISSFHAWGLGTEAQSQRKPDTFKTLAQTMAALGHINRTIDVFKIDCENCEWVTVQDWLEQDIRQILVETHDAPWPGVAEFFFSLHDANSGHCMEYGFLKLSLSFFQNNFYKNLTYDF
eukprot:Nitzschia sp. Nitz4//scaffold395_size11642//624//1502//NITZ4_009030-RA/size11642-processed-gene-0.10-mRNA-1//1//CDS//3329550249//525//frame0